MNCPVARCAGGLKTLEPDGFGRDRATIPSKV
ncbi:protein of unknown function [Methylocella tundrae]|uniref:Uncharacterized protein n=1 Tax=Methylocella tundrae TaxID=227605 RepID=A0A4V6IMI2_METTU|nr:protein of unknown function [Methylocella tundrae]